MIPADCPDCGTATTATKGLDAGPFFSVLALSIVLCLVFLPVGLFLLAGLIIVTPFMLFRQNGWRCPKCGRSWRIGQPKTTLPK